MLKARFLKSLKLVNIAAESKNREIYIKSDLCLKIIIIKNAKNNNANIKNKYKI